MSQAPRALVLCQKSPNPSPNIECDLECVLLLYRMCSLKSPNPSPNEALVNQTCTHSCNFRSTGMPLGLVQHIPHMPHIQNTKVVGVLVSLLLVSLLLVSLLLEHIPHMPHIQH